MDGGRYQTRARALRTEQSQNGNDFKPTGNQTDESGTEAEASARRKFQRTINNDDDSAFRKPNLPASAMRQPAESKMNMFSRRKSTLRENKPLLGPRPLDQAMPKRIFSESTVPLASEQRTSFLPTSASMPVLDRKPKSSRFSFGVAGSPQTQTSSTKSGSFNFLPPVSFDDFQSSIASYEQKAETKLTQFPVLDGEDTSQSEDLEDPPMPKAVSAVKTRRQTVQPATTTNAAKIQPVTPQESTARRDLTKTTKDVEKSSGTTGPLPIRARRQSTAPSAGPTAPVTNRIPRKSVGPGLLSGMLGTKQSKQDQPPKPAPPLDQGVARTPSFSRRRPTFTKSTVPTIEPPRAMMPTRASQAKSLQPPSRQRSNINTTTELRMDDSDQNDADYANDFNHFMEQKMTNTPGKTATSKTQVQDNTPSSSGNKRQSGRLSGLGARTISPTDARRLKRMSVMQNPMPAPRPPPSPQPAIMPDIRGHTKSPSLIPRKMSMTPSSSRDTPDSATRQYIPNFSLSRSSSYQSLRSVNNPGVGRMNPSPSFSKLPTPKGGTVYSSADRRDDEEMVPPVPAIPKAYESPKDQVDTPFFHETRGPSRYHSTATTPVAQNMSSDSALATYKVGPDSRKQSLELAEDPRHRRTLTTAPDMGLGRMNDNTPSTPAAKKKSLQPLRLPPLNLLPLSTPTAAKIASYPQPSAEVDRREVTPPPKRNLAKTPSTPMTASKATFNRRLDESNRSAYNLRSSSSHHALRAAVDNNSFDDYANTVPVPVPNNKRQITPFASGSLPKPNGDFAPPNKTPQDEYSLGYQEVQVQASKPMGPRQRNVSKAVKDSASTHTNSSNEEPETPQSSNSLRRRFSMNWRRSSSKNTSRQGTEQSNETLPADYPKMPPPKLPASATYNSFQEASRKTPTSQTRSSLDTARRVPSQSTLKVGIPLEPVPKLDQASTASNANFRSLHSNSTQVAAVTPRSSSWSMLGMSRSGSTSARPSTATQQPRSSSQQLDKDDLAANDEMRRLAMKRRDVESAAKETDELKKQATAKQLMTPAQAIQSSAGLLNIFEKGEIIDFKDGVYFCGTKSAKKHVGDISAAGTTNFGYDDERGDYNIVMGDHLAYRYEVIDVLGKGSFGQVVRCIDHKLGGLCAVKIIRNKKRFHQQALVEVSILKKLKEWDPDEVHATLTISSSFYFRAHLCIVTPCLSINLYELIRAHSFQGFSLQLIRRFSRQMLACLELLQGKRIIHCDLKPENILLCDPRRADIRVIDFGSSCKTDEKVYTYIQSRFYRSPEVILGSEYGLGIDMWSFGCILAELYTGYPIFPGENEQEQLACIMEIFGPPSRDIIEKCSRRKLFFDSTLKPRVTVSSKGRRRRPSSKALSAALKCDDEAFLDFITQCLRWDPDRRLRPEQAATHPFITREPMRKIPERRPVRAINAQPATNATTGSIPSPIKRTATTTGAISTSSVSAANATPAREMRVRPLPDTPSTAIRSGVALRPIQQTQDISAKSSPTKAAAARRQSSIISGSLSATQAQSLAVAGSKRASNGVLLGQGGFGVGGPTALPRVASGKVGMSADMAGAAARESMGLASARMR